MLPFDVETVILCDDVRQERNGKWLLIGVYAADILVPRFPAELRFALWLLVKPREAGSITAKFRIVGPHGGTLIDAELGANFKSLRPTILALGALPVQLQMEGPLKVDMAAAGSDEWSTIKTIELKIGGHIPAGKPN